MHHCRCVTYFVFSDQQDSKYSKRLRRRKPADTEYITVEPDIYIKEELLSEPEPEEAEDDEASDADFQSESAEEESDSDFEIGKRKRLVPM
jgi:hypothetical protein